MTWSRIADLPLVVEAWEVDRLASATRPELPLAGEWTLGGFCAHLEALEQWHSPPAWEPMRRYRNWAFDSAALDLALRQDGRGLREGLRMYGGGMGELGTGRRQAQLLASLFHPDAPNDIAPTPFNGRELADGLRPSPLPPRGSAGFDW